MVFGNYARYYNLLYKDKDYNAEADYIHTLINRFSVNTAKSILDLGCGTGKHAYLLSQRGYSIDGVDRSEEMIALAKKLESQNLHFFIGDITSITLEKKYDVIVLLFHVLSYITKNEDLEAVFKNISKHLKKDGIVIFDCWYGPAVLTENPSVRLKQLEDDQVYVTRIAEPVMHPNENTIDVNYEVIIEDKIKNTIERISEKHTMRYYFKPEIESILTRNCFELCNCEEWMTGNVTGFTTWGLCVIARKC